MGSYGVSGWEQALQPFQSCVKKTGPHRAATWRNSLFLSLFGQLKCAFPSAAQTAGGHSGDVQVARFLLSPGDCARVSTRNPCPKTSAPSAEPAGRAEAFHFPISQPQPRIVPCPILPASPPRSASFCSKLAEIEGAQTAHLGDPNLI